jgi:hypothetical protein
MNPFFTFVFWLVAIAASIAITYALALVVGMMKAIFLLFELALTAVWLWAAVWQFSLMRDPGSDGGTFIGGLLFLVFGILTLWMLCNEVITTARTQFGVELNLFRRFKIMERLAANAPERPTHAHDIPLNLPPQE